MGKLEDTISRHDIELFRVPKQFIDWFEKWLNSVNGKPDYRSEILLKRGLAKKVFEEVFPLYRLLQHKQSDWSLTEFRNVIGGQHYDVEAKSSSGTSYLEITTADLDENEHFRMTYLERNGHVPAISNVPKLNPKSSIIANDFVQIAQSRNILESEKLVRISQAIAAKSSVPYRTFTSLLVYFDDSITFRNGNSDRMQQLIDNSEATWRGTFESIYIVGSSGSNLWQGTR